MTTTHTIIIQVLLSLIQLGNLATNTVPDKWKPVVLGVIALAQILQAKLAHKFNPDGTPASVAFVAKVLLLVLLLGSPLMAQTNVAQPFHFVAGGSAINFSANGSNVGSVAYTGLQLTAGVAATYEHITVPSLSSRYEIGVISYTTGLNRLLGASLSSKLLFDASNINITFQAGGGKLLTPTANHIAETFGASLSYPIPGTSMAIQVLGYQVVHSPNLWGSVQKNYSQQVQTGVVVYF